MSVAPPPRRDSVTTIGEDGSRRFLFPADSRGPLTRARRASALGLIALYAALPWIRVGGYPAVFLDVARRRFHLFGLTLAAQDLWLMFFLITGLGFSLFVVTALFGRIWCGWACPQTVFLDHVYRRFERWFEGDALARRRLADAPWGPEKAARALAKHGAYLLVSLGVAHVFLAYFVSLPELWAMMRTGPAAHPGAFLFVGLATGLAYFNFAWFREQLCIIICPYGRMQSVLTDEHTLVVGYDAARGEPRGPAGQPGLGDCLACERCVRVCPTGIDIRQGLQLECIGCTACIDACNEVMRRVGRPEGLVRYDSQAGFAGRGRRWWRPRLGMYGLLLALGAAAALWAAAGIHPLLLSATRMVGAPYYVDENFVRDQFLIRVVNKQDHPVRLQLSLSGLPPGAAARGCEAPLTVAPMGEEVRPLILEQARAAFRGSFAVRLRADDGRAVTEADRPLEFLGPLPARDGP